VGETENIGNPTTDAEKAYGRSLPKRGLPDFPIRGYEYYDYRHDVVNTTFRNYEDNATRKTGAISNLLFSSFGVSTNNAFERLKFVNAKPVYFPPMANNSKWASDNGGSTSYKTAAYHDKDGSLGGGPNSFVIIHDGINDSIAVDAEACEIKPTWNAAVCKGDVGRMTFGGGGGFGGARGAGAARGAAPGPGAAGPGAAAAPGAPGGRFGAPAGPPQPPVVLSRNGREFTVTGGTNVRAGTEIKVTTERPSVPFTLTELDRGSWVIFELPGFTTAASGTEQSSLDALRKASATSYYKGNGSLWVKLVSTGDVLGSGPDSGPGGGASLQASR
jgi:cell migration-inducing and hyaluronan-binding protein